MEIDKELLEEIRHELVIHSGLLAVDREDCFHVKCLHDDMVIKLDFTDLIENIDDELRKAK